MPEEWSVATPLSSEGSTFVASNYENLADSPFWIGSFAHSEFKASGADIRVVVDAAPDAFNMPELIRRDRKIVGAEANWMGGLPIASYLFLYQFPKEKGIEGMEHARATAIRIPESATKADMSVIDSVTAHEFFHLWNAMRIRPCSIQRVDYAHEQYSKTLWFSEGVTSTVARYILLRAGMMTEEAYFDRLSSGITDLQNTPARTRQSVEDASVAVWLSGYVPYQAPERSVSYYQKGELLGVILDLEIRKNTREIRSLCATSFGCSKKNTATSTAASMILPPYKW